MGIFKKIFGPGTFKPEDKKKALSWNELKSVDQIDSIIDKSNSNLQAIFKHSTRCGISRGVLKQFERQEDIESIDFYYLDLLEFRDVSNALASRFNVLHQSPQLLIIKNGVVAAHDSHYDILNLDISYL